MLKKLQNLLFEDEEDIVEDDNEAVKPAVSQPIVAPVQPIEPMAELKIPEESAPVIAPIEQETTIKPLPVEEVKPSMPRIDVTQPIQTVTPVEPVEAEKVEKVEKPVLGLTADPTPVDKKKVVKPVEVKPVEVTPVVEKKAEPIDDSAMYQFKPVISPIFGVDEKDVNSLKNTTNKIKKAKDSEKKESNVTPVLSPMYGINLDEPIAPSNDVYSDYASSVDEINGEGTTEDNIPEFSLDDILKVRDEEFANEERPVDEETASSLFPDLTFNDDDDDTNTQPIAPVVDPIEPIKPVENDITFPSLEPEKDDEVIDNTSVIKQQLFDDDEG